MAPPTFASSPTRCCARPLVSGLDSSNHRPPASGRFRAVGMMLFCHFMSLVFFGCVPALVPLHRSLPGVVPAQLRAVNLAWGQFQNRGHCKSSAKEPAPDHWPITTRRLQEFSVSQESERSAGLPPPTGDFLIRRKRWMRRRRRRKSQPSEAYSWDVVEERTRVLSSWALCMTWDGVGPPSASIVVPPLLSHTLLASRWPVAQPLLIEALHTSIRLGLRHKPWV